MPREYSLVGIIHSALYRYSSCRHENIEVATLVYSSVRLQQYHFSAIVPHAFSRECRKSQADHPKRDVDGRCSRPRTELLSGLRGCQ